ncbi:MAG: hypothetical protein FWD45_04855 [Coriobacteriia bacterium]|nr:hypothetical protein [Coriobacteriia bacterium]
MSRQSKFILTKVLTFGMCLLVGVTGCASSQPASVDKLVNTAHDATVLAGDESKLQEGIRDQTIDAILDGGSDSSRQPSDEHYDEFQRFGSEELGYMSVPRSWRVGQYFFEQSTWIAKDTSEEHEISMQVMPNSDPATFIKMPISDWERIGVEDVSYSTTTIVQLDDQLIYQMDGYFTMFERYCTVFVFYGPAGEAVMVSIEGTYEGVAEGVKWFRDTYSFEY